MEMISTMNQITIVKQAILLILYWKEVLLYLTDLNKKIFKKYLHLLFHDHDSFFFISMECYFKQGYGVEQINYSLLLYLFKFSTSSPTPLASL